MLFVVPVLISMVFYLQIVIFPRVPTRVVVDMESRVTIDMRAAEPGEILEGRLPTQVPVYSRFYDGTEIEGFYIQHYATGKYALRQGAQPDRVRHVFGGRYGLVWKEYEMDLSHFQYHDHVSTLPPSRVNDLPIQYHPLVK